MALGGIKDKHAVPSLIVTLKDDSRQVRSRSAMALGSIGDSRAVEPLLTVLQNRSEHSVPRTRSATALGQIGDPRAIEPLLRILKDTTDNTDVRDTCASALGHFQDTRVIEPLVAALRDSNADVRDSASLSLGLMDRMAAGPVLQVLKDPSPEARSAAVNALLFIDDEAVIGPLIASLEDQNADVRNCAGRALSGKEDKRATAALLSALARKDLAAVAGAYDFFIRQGKADSEPVLVAALTEYGYSPMAEAFFNSGNATLKAAANRWAREHKEKLEESTLDPKWGSKK
ncbi:MAG: HEAT repeat domain-containing protein [Actinobacteria bacterium]|nr:HEAT repeat domain-containing protein [Actinomycetota bacterium]